MRRTSAAAAIASFIILGCAEGRSDEVRLTPVASWTGPEIVARDEHRFCDTAEVADTSCSLGPIQLATLTSAGRVFAADPGRIVVLEDSMPLRTISRQGNGPGEIRGPFAMRVDSAGSLRVFDVRRMRYLVLGDTGATADVAALPPMTMVGLRLGDTGLHVLSVPAAVRDGDSVTAYVIRRSVADTAWADTVARFPERAVFRKGGEGMFPPSLPWDRKLLWDVCGRGDVVVAASDAWRLTRYRRDAAPVTSVRPDARGRPVTAADRDSLVAARLAKAPPGPFRAALAERVAKPAVHAVIDDVRCDEDGFAYVRNAPAPGATQAQWDVLGPSGERVAVLSLPLAFRVLDVRGPRLVGVEEAASGAEVIVTKRVFWSGVPSGQ